MTDYTKLTDFAAKDSLLSGNPAKVVRGTEIDAEFTNIAVAVATKTDDADAAITGGTIDGVAVTNSTVNSTPIGGSTPAAGAFTTVSASGQVTSTVSTGTAPLVIASTTKVANLNVDQLDGADWASPGAIGGTTPAAGAFTTVSATSGITATNCAVNMSDGYSVRWGNTNIYGGNGTDMVFTAGNVESFRVNAATQNVGIGTNSPGAYKLNVNGNTNITGALSATGDISTSSAGSLKLGNSDSTNTYNLQNVGATGAGNGALSFVQAGVAERMRLDASGNLGLGVTPSAWGSGYKALEQQTGVFYGSAVNTLLQGQNTYQNGTNWIYKTTAAASLTTSGSGITAWYTAPSGTAGNTISWTQAMTLDDSGKWLLNCTAPMYSNPEQAHVFGAVSSGSQYGLLVGGDPSVYTCYAMRFIANNSGSVVGSITFNTTSAAYNTTSDYRLKENVRPANAARFMDIEFVDFEWVDGRHDCGVIADQLQSVYPDLVLGEKDATEVRTVEITPAIPEVKDEDGNVTQEAVPAVTEEQTFPVYQQVNYTGLIGRMGTRVQQLQRTVDAQAALIAAMEARLTALEAA